jgi:hypothetical protein
MSDLAATASATEDDNKLNVARFARTETVADDDRSVAIRIQITDLRLIVA